VIATLGGYWTHRVITLPGAPVVRHGPYRWLRHPNYAVSVAETALLPLVFGAWQLAVIVTPVWWAVLRYKARLEEEGLAGRAARAEPHVSTSTP
jgi:methyltransferase